MEFDLPCECRKVHRVSIGLAGTSIACDACAAQIRPRRVGRFFKVLALVCGIAGLGLLITWRVGPAFWLFGGSIALRLAARSRRLGEQARLRQVICRMAEYNDLFRKYPRATIQF